MFQKLFQNQPVSKTDKRMETNESLESCADHIRVETNQPSGWKQMIQMRASILESTKCCSRDPCLDVARLHEVAPVDDPPPNPETPGAIQRTTVDTCKILLY